VKVLDSTCGVGGVSIRGERGEELAITEDDGLFAAAFSIGTEPLLSFVFPNEDGTESDHILEPSSFQLPLLLKDYKLPITIKDMTTREVEVTSILGGQCEIPVADGPVNLYVRDCSFDFSSLELPSIHLHRSKMIAMPAHRIRLVLDKSNLKVAERVDLVDVVEFLENTRQDSQSLDLRFNASAYKMVYFNQPRIEFLSVPFILPNPLAGCTKQALGVDGLVPSGAIASYRFSVYEEYSNLKCNSGNGSMSVVDFTVTSGPSDPPVETTIELDECNSYTYSNLTGGPNIVNPYTKNQEWVAKIRYEINGLEGELSTSALLRIAVLGSTSLENTFTARTSSLPVLILRDPPGGASYVELTKSSTITTTFSFGGEAGSEWLFGGDAKIGINTESSIGGLFALSKANDIKLYLGAEAYIGASLTTANQETLEFNLEAQETIRTSEAIGLAGEKGDVMVGFALIVANGLTRQLRVASDPDNICSFALLDSIEVSPLSADEDTYYIYSHNYVESTLIPNIERAISLLDQQGETAERNDFQNDLNQWKNILDFKQDRSNEEFARFSSANDTVIKLFNEFQEQGTSYFNFFRNYGSDHGFAHPAAIEPFAFIQATASFVTSLNVPGGQAAGYFYLFLESLTFEAFSKGIPERTRDKVEELEDLFNSALDEFRSSLRTTSDQVKRLSFDGGAGGFQQVISTSRAQGMDTEIQVHRDNELSSGKAEYEGGVFGFGWKSQSNSAFKGSATSQRSSGYESSRGSELVIYLDDPNPTDSFVVDIFQDSYYGTPIFKVSPFSRTSCPYEPGTDRIERPFIQAVGPTRLENVPASEAAVFHLSVSNLAEV